jgi:hypothetical protein
MSMTASISTVSAQTKAFKAMRTLAYCPSSWRCFDARVDSSVSTQASSLLTFSVIHRNDKVSLLSSCSNHGGLLLLN